jgi:prophage regulatory protein
MERILRESERKHVTGICRVVWWRLERSGKVPRRVQISSRAVGWLESEIQAWMRARAEARCEK